MKSLSRWIVGGVVASVVVVFWLSSATSASAATVTAAATPWSVVPSPNPPASSYSELSGVSCTSKVACVAVGTSHVPGYSMLTEVWDGSDWTIQQIPSSSAAAQSGVLLGVSCSSAAACTAVGYLEEASGSTLPLVEVWNGHHWTQQAAPLPPGSLSSVLSAVSCVSAAACTAVGYSDVAPAGDFVTLAEAWNGSTWTIEPTPNPANASQLSGVSCTSGKACTAVGSSQQPGPIGPRGGTTTLAEAWNGTKWSVQSTPPLASSPLGELSAVQCVSKNACMAVGYSGLSGAAVPLADVWNGSTWEAQATPSVSGAQATQLDGVSCTSANACTAVGAAFFADSIPAVAETWNGKAWTIQATPDPSVHTLSAVSCNSATRCTAVGYSYQAATDSYTTLVEVDPLHGRA